ncbi:reverse transcriptase domain-containing protein [Tanacetum coccineum]
MDDIVTDVTIVVNQNTLRLSIYKLSAFKLPYDSIGIAEFTKPIRSRSDTATYVALQNKKEKISALTVFGILKFHPRLLIIIGSGIDYSSKFVKFDINDPEGSLTSAMMLLARAITQRYSTPTNNRLRSSSNIRNQVVVHADRVNIQSRNVGNDGRIARRLYNVHEETTGGSNCYSCNEKGHYACKCPKPRVRDSKYFMEQMLLAKKDEAGLEELSANICMMARIQPSNVDSDEGPSYDSAFISEVQTPSTSYMNDDHEQTCPEQPKIINSTIGDDQINSNIIFDDPNVKVNNGSVDHDKYVHDPCELEQLARNAYKEAKKQQVIANKVKQQNVVLTKCHTPPRRKREA